MTTPLGVPNLPVGALTVETLGQQLQDQTSDAMRARAGDQMPGIFSSSTGGDILNSLSPFGIITSIWSGINSLIATGDPADIQGPEDLPPLMLDFIEGLPFIGQFVTLFQALVGTYDGEDETLLGIQELLSPVVGFFTDLIDEFGSLANWLLTFDLSAALQDVENFFAGLADRAGFLSVFEDVIAFFGTITDFSTWTGVLEDVIAFFSTITTWSTWSTALKTLIDGLLSITNLSTWTTLLKQVIAFFGTVTDFASWSGVLKQVIDFFGTITSFSTWSGVLKQVIDFFATISSGIRGTWLNLLNDVVTFFGSVSSFPTWSAALKTLIDQLLTVTNLSTWVTFLTGFINSILDVANLSTFMTTLKTLVNGLLGTLNFSTWVTTFKTLIDGLLGITSFSTWVGVFKQVIDFFSTITAGARGAFLTAIKTVTEFFQGVISSFGSLPDWLARIPSLAADLIGDLWSLLNGGAEAVGKTINDVLTSVGDFAAGLIQNITGNPAALGLGDVGTWALNLLDKGLTWPDFKTLFGDVPASILGVLPIPNISLVNPELMSQGGFDTSTTLAPGSGWAWDGTQRYPPTATTGGSAKVTGAGTTRQLYSNQSIEVAQGDKLLVSCWVKSTGTVGAGGIVLSIVEFNGTTQGTTRTIASRASSTPWVQIGNMQVGATPATPYVVGAGVTSIRVRLAITSAAVTGSAVWFDDISVKKTGLLDGSWMEGLLGTVVDDFQTIADSIAQAIKSVGTAGTGNALTTVLTNIQSIFSRLFGIVSLPASLIVNPLLEAAIPGLSGSKITSGEVNVDWLPITDIADEIGTTPVTGSGGKMSRRNTATKITAAAGNAKFGSSFYVTSGGSSGVEQISSDITASHVNGRYTVTYAGYYLVEVGFTTNASAPAAGYFNVAPAIYLNGSTTPYKVGADALGSFGEVLGADVGNYSRSAHSTFIVYLGAGGYVEAGYVNFGASNASFFEGDSAGNSTYFGIAMLNRTAEG